MAERDQLSLSEALMSPSVGRNEALSGWRGGEVYRFEKLLGRLGRRERGGHPL